MGFHPRLSGVRVSTKRLHLNVFERGRVDNPLTM